MEWPFWQITHKIVILFILIFNDFESFQFVSTRKLVVLLLLYHHLVRLLEQYNLGFRKCVSICRNIVILVFSFILLSSNFFISIIDFKFARIIFPYVYLLRHLSRMNKIRRRVSFSSRRCCCYLWKKHFSCGFMFRVHFSN